MELNLKNPILFFDIESTGLNVAIDRIVEISAIKISPNGDQEIKTRRINPEYPISAEAEKIHGISNEDVKDCPPFKQVAKSMAQWMAGCDIAGYNSIRFDVPLLAEEFLRADVEFDFRKRRLIDVQNIFHKLEQRTLVAAYKFYCQKELENAHSAEADTIATYEILKSQLDKYPELENDMDFLAEFSTKSRFVDYAGRIALNEQDIPVFNFGKHKGTPVTEILKKEQGYYSWIMNGDFTRDTKKVLTEIKLKMQ